MILRTALTLSLLSACTGPIEPKARLGLGDFADATSTAIALNSGFVELNPIYSGAGAGAPILSLALKYGFKYALIEWADLPAKPVNKTVETFGFAASCWNLSILTSGTNPASAAAAIICGVLYATQIEKLEKSVE